MMCGGRQKHPPNHDAVSLPPSPPKCGMFASLVNMTRDEILIFGAPQKLILPPPRNLLPPPSMAEEGDEAKSSGSSVRLLASSAAALSPD